jgi:SWIM zinc finger
MTISPDSASQTVIIVPTLQKADPVRLEKAILGIFDGTLSVTLISTSDAHIRATVKNSTRSYQVSLTADGTTCECPDSTHREGIVCKHATAVALFASRPPQQQVQQFPTHHLRWSSGEIVCHANPSEKAWQWPWTLGMTHWPECCASCARILTIGSKKYWDDRTTADATARVQPSSAKAA